MRELEIFNNNNKGISDMSTIKCKDLIKLPYQDIPGKNKCKDCKKYTCNYKEYKDGVDCHRLLNKKLSKKEIYIDNNDCKYYEEYIGYPNSCSSCEHVKFELDNVEDGEYKAIYKCKLDGKIIDNTLKDINTFCENYLDINFKED